MRTFFYILVPFLITVQALAQFRLEVFDLHGNSLGGADFETYELAQKNCEDNCGKGAWGKPERLVPLDGASDEERALAIEVIPADEINGIPSQLKLRKTYSYTITDVTQERQAEEAARAAAITKKTQAREALKDCNTDDLESATTIAGLRSALRKCLPGIVELIK